MALPRANLTKLLIRELAAVPTGAQEAQGTAILKSKDPKAKEPTSVNKRSALTSAEHGHTHVLYGIDDSQAGTTSYESTYAEDQSNDRYTGHSHPWVRGEDGAIVLGEAMGHTHAVGTMSAALAKTAAAKSTRSGEIDHVGLTPENPMSQTPDLAKQLADLTKSNERLARISKISGAHKAHFDTLSGDDAEAFLAKSTADREAVVAEVAKRDEEANKVVYVSKSTGDVYKAKDDARLVEMAKRMDEQAVSIEKADIRKRAADCLGGMPGTDDVHDLIVRSVLKSGAKQEEIDAAVTALKAMKASSTLGKSAPGFGGTSPELVTQTDALGALEKGLTAFAKAQNISKNVWTDGLAAFVKTDEGAALKRAYDESRS